MLKPQSLLLMKKERCCVILTFTQTRGLTTHACGLKAKTLFPLLTARIVNIVSGQVNLFRDQLVVSTC